MRWLFSLVVALAIAGAPVALEACQIACASMTASLTSTPDMHQAHHHHTTARGGTCHEGATASERHLLTPMTACDHDVEATAPSVLAARTSDDILLIASAVSLVADPVLFPLSTLIQPYRSALPDRLEIRLAAPIRI